MHSIKTLLDHCVTLCGSQRALAERIGSTQQDVHKWTTGKRPLSPATVGQLCDLLQLEGNDAQRLAAEAIINNAKPEKQGVLRRAFFAPLDDGRPTAETSNEETAESTTSAPQVENVGIDAAESRITIYDLCLQVATAAGHLLGKVNMGRPPFPRGS